MSFRWAGWLGLLIAAGVMASAGAPADATFPGANGKIAFAGSTEGVSGIFVMNADGSGVTRLTKSPGVDSGPAWSPDGAKIAFTRIDAVPTLGQTGQYDIWVVNADGSGLVNLTNDPGVDGSPAWSPDGSRIAFSSYREGTGNFEIFVMAPDGSGLRQLTNAGNRFLSAAPSWSPDGTTIAFERGGQTGPSDICVMRVDGGGEVNLTSSPEFDSSPDWSPDGSRIAFNTQREGGLWTYTMNPDGSGVTPMISEPNVIQTPKWSPDGAMVAFVAGGAPMSNPGIWVMRIDGTERVKLSDGSTAEVNPAWQPLPGARASAPSTPAGRTAPAPVTSTAGCVPVFQPRPEQPYVLPVDGGYPGGGNRRLLNDSMALVFGGLFLAAAGLAALGTGTRP